MNRGKQQSDFFYFRRFKTTIIALALVLVWANRGRLMRLPGLLLDAMCWLCCERRNHDKTGHRARSAASPQEAVAHSKEE